MQRNIDQLFKQGVGPLDTEPATVTRDPEANWERIEGMLGHERKYRRGAWIWVSAAATVALLIALGWGLMPSRKAHEVPTDGAMAFAPENLVEQDSMKVADHVAMTKEPATTEGQEQNEYRDQQPSNISFRGVVTQQGRKVVRGGNWAHVGMTTNQPINTGTATVIASGGTTTVFNNTQGQSYTYTWSFGDGKEANKQQLTYATPGTYTIGVTDANGCKGGKFAAVNAQKVPALGFFNTVADSTVSFAVADPYGYESYAETVENAYFMTTQEPLSTFSIDVDRASYTNHRRFIESSQMPPKYSVRVEEFINYFPYEYQPPRNGAPFSILPEVTTCPWNPKHKLVRIALKGREIATDNLPPSNIVFLLDVSGSMEDENKLPLLKKAMGMLTEQLREQDKVSIVVYAGAAGLVLPPTSGNNKVAIMGALDQLSAGGSTAGGEGIELAYATARQNFKKGGNNRVILATDGDFNVGISDENGLEKLIVKKREEGVFLSVLGFGEGNLQDSKMEILADKGNGNYNYIDTEREASKVLVSEFGGTLFTIAKDVKIQVEFNPAQVASYRLVGYENRKLRNEDFANDKIDAGELGAGHTVTALYEIVPAGEATSSTSAEQLKYQQRVLSGAAASNEVLTVKLRYKDPEGSVSKLLEQTLHDDGRNIAQTSIDFRWAVAVAEYGLILRESEFKGGASLEQVIALAKSAIGTDKGGYRKEFIELVNKAIAIQQSAKLNVRNNGN